MTYRLLLSDDSITIQKVVELVLAEEGFDIKATNDGEEALSVVPSFRPDVILADIEMPKINGYQLCEKIKTNPDTKDIPVILLAGAFEPLDEELAKNVGADDYIVKPFESQELISKINAVIAAKEMVQEAPVEAFAAEEAPEALEAVVSEEDLWAMEEIPSESVLAEGLVEETPVEAAVAEAPGFAEAAEAEFEPEKAVVEEAVAEAAATVPPATPSMIEFPSKEDVADMLRKAVDERISTVLSSSDIKDSLFSSLTPAIRDSAEKVLWEVAPELVEKLLREMLEGTFASLSKEVEKVIWETVPALAETMISKEIEKIKSVI
ncbi:MAG: hypothetical protein OHK0032_16770 [Thermodesulfovibrionales bacterium]